MARPDTSELGTKRTEGDCSPGGCGLHVSRNECDVAECRGRGFEGLGKGETGIMVSTGT